MRKRKERMAQSQSKVVRDLIENNMEGSFSSKIEGGSKGEELRGSCRRQEKRPINDDTGVDQKLEKLKE